MSLYLTDPTAEQVTEFNAFVAALQARRFQVQYGPTSEGEMLVEARIANIVGLDLDNTVFVRVCQEAHGFTYGIGNHERIGSSGIYVVRSLDDALTLVDDEASLLVSADAQRKGNDVRDLARQHIQVGLNHAFQGRKRTPEKFEVLNMAVDPETGWLHLTVTSAWDGRRFIFKAKAVETQFVDTQAVEADQWEVGNDVVTGEAPERVAMLAYVMTTWSGWVRLQVFPEGYSDEVRLKVEFVGRTPEGWGTTVGRFVMRNALVEVVGDSEDEAKAKNEVRLRESMAAAKVALAGISDGA